MTSQKGEDLTGQGEVLKSCACGNCGQKNPTTQPSSGQLPKLHPMTRRGLDNLRVEIVAGGRTDLTAKSALDAIHFLLRNY